MNSMCRKLTTDEHEDHTHQECPLCSSRHISIKFVKPYMGQWWFLRHCIDCGLHFTAPIPTLEFLSMRYGNTYHANLRIEGATEKLVGAKFKRYTCWLKTYLTHGSRVLDIGCSTGLLVKMLCESGYEAEGLEINPNSAEWGRNNYRITIHNTSLKTYHIPRKKFDAIVLADVLEHTMHPKNYLMDIRHNLNPHGLVMVTFPDICSIESRYLYLIAKLTRYPSLWRTCYIPSHIWEFTPKTAIKCFEAAGFDVVDFRRFQLESTGTTGKLLRLIDLPCAILKWPCFSARFGTQMEYIIRCRDTSYRNDICEKPMDLDS